MTTYVKQTCHLPRLIHIRQLTCHTMVVAPAVITIVDRRRWRLAAADNAWYSLSFVLI